MPTQVDLTINTKADTSELRAYTDQAQELINTLKLGVGIDLGGKAVEGLQELVSFFKDGIAEGVKFNSSLQDAQLSLAALLRSFEPQKFQSLNSALAESGKAVETLKQKAVSSPFNFDQLLESLQSISAPLFSGGVKDLQKQIDLTLLLANAAKTLNIPQQILPNESRDLIEGRANRTFLGRGLGIQDDDIKKATQAGQLYQFLTQKLEVYGEAGAESLKNYSTQVSVLHDNLQQLAGTGTEGVFREKQNIVETLGSAVGSDDFKDVAQDVGSELAVITEGVGSLIKVLTDHPYIFSGLAQAAVSLSVSMALINIPRVVLGLVQLASAAPAALEGVAALSAAAKDDGAAMAASVANIEANTAALLANAEAASIAGAARAEGQSSGLPGAIVGEAASGASSEAAAVNAAATTDETAAIEANTIAKTENAEASAAAGTAIVGEADAAAAGAAEVGAAAATAGIGISSMLGPIGIVLIALTQVYIAFESYLEKIKESNDELQKGLTNQLGSLKQQSDTVSTIAEKTQLIASLKENEQRADAAISTAKSHWLAGDQTTLNNLEAYKAALDELISRTQGYTDAQLDERHAMQTASDAMDQQLEKLGHLADGYDKAKVKYQEMLATEQIEHGKTAQDKLAGVDQLQQVHLDELNSQIVPGAQIQPFQSISQVQAYVDAATDNARKKSYDDAQKKAADATQAAAQKFNDLQAQLDQAQAARQQLTASQGSAQWFGTPAELAPPTNPNAGKEKELDAQIATLTKKLDDAKSALGNAQTASKKALNDSLANKSLTTAALLELDKMKDTAKQTTEIQKAEDDSLTKLNDSTNKLLEDQNSKSYKARNISLQQYIQTKRDLAKSDYDLQVQKVNQTPGLTDTERANELGIAKNAYTKNTSDIDAESKQQSYTQSSQAAQEHARQLEEQAEQARAAGNVNLVESLENQVQLYQKISQILGNINLSEKDRAAAVAATIAANDKIFAQQQAQKNAETALETQEKQTSTAMQQLQSQRQLIEGGGYAPQAKNDALRANLLAQNNVLDQQIALLEQRRLLALQDPTQSPNQRALTAAGIQGQEDQYKGQKTQNDITANKLTPEGQFTSSLQDFGSSFGTMAQQSANVVTGTLGGALQTISSHLTDIIKGTETVGQAFVGMVDDVVVQLIELIIKLGLTLALQEALDVAGIYSAPAAGAGAATLATSMASVAGLAGAAFAEGGLVAGTPSHSDNRIATIASGEYVARTAAVQHYGPGVFESLNRMAIPRDHFSSLSMPVRARRSLGFASGGLVGPLPGMGSGGAAATPIAGSTNFHVAAIHSSSQLNQWARQGDGKKVILDLVRGEIRDIGLTS